VVNSSIFVFISTARHMSSVTLSFVTVTASATLSPTTTTSSLSTAVITLQHSSIADVLPTNLPQPSSRGEKNMQFTDERFPALTVGIAAGVGGGFLLAMFIVVIVIAVFLIFWRRKRKYSLNADQDHYDRVLNNPLYGHQG